MSLTVNLIDRDGQYVQGWITDYQIDTDDEFAVVEREAQRLAARGIVVAIQWYRDDDGQTAYWSPSGATLRPYWYWYKAAA